MSGPQAQLSRADSARSLRVSSALVEVLGTRRRVAGFLGAAGVVTFVYTLLLPFDYTQRVELANWDYLDARLLAWAIVLGLFMGLVVSVQIYAMRKVVAARTAAGAAGGVAFVVSLLPSFLCCTPIIPSLLAFVGVSGVGLYTTTGTLQHFFAVHQNELLAASLAMLALMGWWGLRKVARAACLSDDGCAVDAMPEEPDGARSDRGASPTHAARPAPEGAPR
jgi:hypothetical protein